MALSHSCRPMVRVGYSRGFPGQFRARRNLRRRSLDVFRLAPHGPPSDLADLVLDSPASPGALVHGGLMHLEQEGGRRRTRGQSLLLPNPGERLEVLARPVDVYAAGDAVPLF